MRRLDRDAACYEGAVQMADAGWLDPADSLVQRAAIVPDDNIAKAPFVNINMFRSLLHGEQFLQQIFGFVRCHAFDRQSMARRNIERPASRLGVGAHDGVDHVGMADVIRALAIAMLRRDRDPRIAQPVP